MEKPSMSIRKWVFRVRHILEAIERIQQYTAGMDEAGFAGDQKTIDAVVRNFQVIGEASTFKIGKCDLKARRAQSANS
jgi:uncharacterized protein with HEPN domain